MMTKAEDLNNSSRCDEQTLGLSRDTLKTVGHPQAVGRVQFGL